MCASLLLTAKWTSAPLGKESSGWGTWPLGLGGRSKRYWSIASPTLCVKSVLSSAVGRRHRQTVQEQHQVDAVLVMNRVPHLADDAQAVGGVAGQDVGVDRQRGFELGY
jgi:hypothetical protein